MKIAKQAVVSFHYRLYEDDVALENSWEEGEPMVYLHGAKGMLPGVERALEGKSKGDKLDITLAPEDAYGHRRSGSNERVLIKHLRSKKKPRPGDVVSVNTESGPRQVVVLKVGRFNVDVDTNHPLAGKTLRFEIEVGEVRAATEEELTHGHAHGPGGHQH